MYINLTDFLIYILHIIFISGIILLSEITTFDQKTELSFVYVKLINCTFYMECIKIKPNVWE